MADNKSKSKIQAADSAVNGSEAEPSLGHLITETRERKGLTREQVATEGHLPPHYIKMIETDSYDMISDRLYLVPFIRRYAAFLGLDAEEIASRFVTTFNMPKPTWCESRKRSRWSRRSPARAAESRSRC